jgi:DNA-binding transcriptional LysR family regulator
MEMHQVRYFRALCEELNFSRAAERCHVSQPALSRAIAQLESELGGHLFHRERGNVHLTELGRIVRPHLDEIGVHAVAAARRARDHAAKHRVRLKLGIMCTIAPAQLVDFVSEFRSSHASIDLDIIDASACSLDKDLIMGDLEAAIYCMPEKTRDRRLHYLALFREQVMIVVGPQHRLAKLDAVKVIDLKDENYLERINCEFGVIGDQVFDDLRVRGETVYRSDRDDWILAMAAAGLGYAFMPRHLVTHARVVALPLVEPEFWREVSLVTVRGRAHSPAVGALIAVAMRSPWLGGQALAVKRLGGKATPPKADRPRRRGGP